MCECVCVFFVHAFAYTPVKSYLTPNMQNMQSVCYSFLQLGYQIIRVCVCVRPCGCVVSADLTLYAFKLQHSSPWAKKTSVVCVSEKVRANGHLNAADVTSRSLRALGSPWANIGQGKVKERMWLLQIALTRTPAPQAASSFASSNRHTHTQTHTRCNIPTSAESWGDCCALNSWLRRGRPCCCVSTVLNSVSKAGWVTVLNRGFVE